MNQTAFEIHYGEIYRDLFHFALYNLGNPEDAEDAVGEAVADAYQGMGKLRSEDAFRAWIFKILTVKCRRKRKDYLHKHLALDEGIDVAGAAWNVEENQDVRNAFFMLSDQERLIVSLSVFGGYNSREIGRSLLLKDTTVRSKLSRALEKMQKYLEN